MDNTGTIVAVCLYIIPFTICYALILAASILALRNLKVIVFRSLGKQYIVALLVLSTILHLANVWAMLEYTFTPNSTMTLHAGYDTVDSMLAGVRMWLIAMIFSTLIGRQFVLSKIFNTYKLPCTKSYFASRIQNLWSPLILSSMLWIPMIALFFLYYYNIVSIVPFVICFTLYYALYIAVFCFLAYKNRSINRNYSDYTTNVIVAIILTFIVVTGMFITLGLQDLFVSDFYFELTITYAFGLSFSLPTLIVLAKPCFIFCFRKQQLLDWSTFNKNNGFLYGQNSSEHNNNSQSQSQSKSNNNMESQLQLESQSQSQSQLDIPSQLLSSSTIVETLTS